MFAEVLLMGCSSSDDASSEDQGAQSGPVAESLDALSLQIGPEEPFRIDASPLPGPVGEPPLEGNIVLKFLSPRRDLSVLQETIPLVATGYAGDPANITCDAKGRFVAVFYDVTNETGGVLRPGPHVNGGFTMVDDTGLQWSPASFATRPFDASAAFAFGISAGATGIRLRSELLGMDVALGD